MAYVLASRSCQAELYSSSNTVGIMQSTAIWAQQLSSGEVRTVLTVLLAELSTTTVNKIENLRNSLAHFRVKLHETHGLKDASRTRTKITHKS